MSGHKPSVPDTESSIASRPDKGPSPSSSPQPSAAVISSEQHSWSFAASGTQPDDKSDSDPTLDTNKVQLPSIFTTFQDPFRSEIRRASLPSLSADSSTNTRYRHSPYPLPSARRPHIPINQSNLGSYHFPSPLDTQDAASDKSSVRPRLDTHLNTAYCSTASSSQIPPSAFGSPLTSDLRPVSYIEGDGWANSPHGISRPNSTPGQQPMSGHDTMRHSTFKAYLTSSAPKSDEWSFPNHQDFVLPPNPYNTTSSSLSNTQQPPAAGNATSTQPSTSSPTRSPQQAPAPSTLVDRPTRKRGKLPKETTDYLKAWLHRHSDHPYPSEEEKKQLCHATGLSMSQVSNWMINVRRLVLA
ncbi:homeobox KN domain-containing protein [Pisolithus orientalis]|uniref:homeobox KN domain-containing protein n=1 Tax=Pisolithus orientalis TaxID=936130 RepID=UPI0022257634|nr:homeobox KN domain-containing protein [Pisolithus orientalis]KAI6030797.1 homeobox KN domain-containing protein [Pisolithus orientalis]